MLRASYVRILFKSKINKSDNLLKNPKDQKK